MRRIGSRRLWLGGGMLMLVATMMVAAAPAVPTGGNGGAEHVERAALVARAIAATPSEAPVTIAEPAVAPAVEGMERGTEIAGAVLETQVGSASYYANMLAGRRTASGVPYDPAAAVAAHRQLPFGTRLRVHNLANGRAVEVEVVDRGPFAKGRILDLSRSAARALGFIRQGHTRVRIEVLEYGGG